MTRTAARELAVLICASMSPEETADETLERFFEPEHYASLAGEGEQFAEYPNKKQLAYIREVVLGVSAHRGELDGYIEQYAHGWRPERLSRAAAAILRCAMCEMKYLPLTGVRDPNAAAINEAVELAKKYEGDEVPGFVNGVLGGFVRGEFPEAAE